jgi:RNA polymerase sigma-70 factor (ECF subfamily)
MIQRQEHLVSNPESEWFSKAQHGDDEAYSHLVETYQTPVYNLCYRMLGESGEAEDAAQESFWRAYQSIRRYDQNRSFATWLLSIAAHYCIDQLRKRHYNTVPLDILPEEDAPDPAPSPESITNRREQQQQIRRLLAVLGPQDRAAIIMRYWYDFSDEEIANSLSLTVSAVKSRLHRARLELARQLQTGQAQIIVAERRKHESPAF